MKERNYGIDSLRLVAMFMIIVLHIMKHGGILDMARGIDFAIVWLIEAICCVAVNCYALISGYIFSNGEKYCACSKYLKLWIQVLFYSVLFQGLESVVVTGVSMKEIVKSFVPVTTSQYWYFTAYTPLFFLAPFIYRYFGRSTEKEAKWCLGTVAIGLLYISIVGIMYDPFKIQGGYSFVWLSLLFVLGIGIRRLEIEKSIPLKWALLAIGGCVICSYGVKLCIPSQNVLITYTSVTTVVMSIGLIVIFSKLQLGKRASRIIKILTPTSFGIYLIHDNNVVRRHFIKDRFIWILEEPSYTVVGYILLSAIVIFVICVLFEMIRLQLFRILRISQICEMGESLLIGKIKKLLDNGDI